MEALQALGFDPEMASAAMAATGNVDSAAELLLSGISKADLEAMAGGGSSDAAQWQCAVCTLLNDSGAPNCSVCASPNPAVAPPAAAAERGSGRGGRGRRGRRGGGALSFGGSRAPASIATVAAVAFDPSSAPRPSSKKLPPKEKASSKSGRKQYRRLREVFLKMPTLKKEEEDSQEKGDEVHDVSVSGAVLDEKIPELLPEITGMTCRRNITPVLDLVKMTAISGLPILNGQPALQRHTIRALQYILAVVCGLVGDVPEGRRRMLMQRIADAFQSCQAEQCRVIDAVYGSLLGRDKSFKDQVRALVDAQKELVMERTVTFINPGALTQDDNTPQKQVPHICSAYRIAIGPALGMHGVQAAMLDVNAPPQDQIDKPLVYHTFRRLFHIQELIEDMVRDVNQQQDDAERALDRDALGRWAGNREENNGFPSHSIFYDEENASAYGDERPTEENEYQPFLNHDVALHVLTHLFLGGSGECESTATAESDEEGESEGATSGE